jgi:murein L,D-transpeptidase YcbB/YkuD
MLVYIDCFTTWVDEQGQVNFYKDIYERDEKLAELLFYKK